MPNCDYCNESFEDQDSYVEHLADDHRKNKLGVIDQRRVERLAKEGRLNLRTVLILLVVGVMLVGTVVGAVLLMFDEVTSDTSNTDLVSDVEVMPTNQVEVEYESSLTFEIDHKFVDFSEGQNLEKI